MDKTDPAHKGKILIVDDDEGIRGLLAKFLKSKGHKHVKAVATGQEALEIIENDDIKLVLLDIRLADVSGLAVLRRIKAMKKDVGVILITGFPDEKVAKDSLKLGAYDYIRKPFNYAYLESSVLNSMMMRM